MSGHKIGTRCKIERAGSPWHGLLCTVVSDVYWCGFYFSLTRGMGSGFVQNIEVDGVAVEDGWSGHAAFPSELIPLYDGNQAVSWSDCVWQPNSVSA